jgi:hypothetical protein
MVLILIVPRYPMGLVAVAESFFTYIKTTNKTYITYKHMYIQYTLSALITFITLYANFYINQSLY